MAMNSSGPISLAGPTAGQSISLTIGRTATTTTSLGEPDVRTLAGVPSGPIAMPGDFYNKAWSANSATFFMMGGGGAGGTPYGSGGGGGQMIGQNTGVAISVTKGVVYSIVVGGAGSNSSVFNGAYTAIAGGNGGRDFVACGSGGNGGTGACGGGGGADCGVTANCSGGAGIYGGAGGAGRSVAANSAGNGGGGGLGGAGGSAYRSGITNYGGNGGASIASTFNPSGASTRYGGGSPGVWFCGSGDPQENGSWPDGGYGPNTGYGTYSGVVIIRISNQFQIPTTTGSPSFTNSGGYFWFTFTGSGTITF